MTNRSRVRTIKKTTKKAIVPGKKETEQSKMARKRADVQRAALRKAKQMGFMSGMALSNLPR
jgi:ribosomal protein S20